MTQDTQSKFAAILAAAQAKASNKTTQSFPFRQPTNFEAVQPKPEPIPEPEQPTQSQPELSSFTIEDILTGCEPVEDAPQEPGQPKNAVQIVDYSIKAFAVIGDTKPIKHVLKALGGRFNNFLTCGPGWIFSKTRYEAVKVSLSL